MCMQVQDGVMQTWITLLEFHSTLQDTHTLTHCAKQVVTHNRYNIMCAGQRDTYWTKCHSFALLTSHSSPNTKYPFLGGPTKANNLYGIDTTESKYTHRSRCICTFTHITGEFLVCTIRGKKTDPLFKAEQPRDLWQGRAVYPAHYVQFGDLL